MAEPKLIAGRGLFDTRKGSGRDYDTTSLGSLRVRIRNPLNNVQKKSAPWFIPSDYAGSDGRNHRVQRERGRFWALCGDVDSGNPSRDVVWHGVDSFCAKSEWYVWSTKSSTEDNKRWRFVIPLAESISGREYEKAQAAMFDCLAGLGVECDYAMAKAGQIAGLPNAGAYYKWVARECDRKFDVRQHPIWEIVTKPEAAPDTRQVRTVQRRKLSGKGDYASLDVVSWFHAHGHYLGPIEGNVHAVRCPFGHDKNTHGDCVVFEARGSWPGFSCKHNSCQKARHTIRDVIALWGDADTFCSREWEAQQ